VRMSNYGVRSGSEKDEEQICKEKSVSELSVYYYYYTVILLLLLLLLLLNFSASAGKYSPILVCSNQHNWSRWSYL